MTVNVKNYTVSKMDSSFLKHGLEISAISGSSKP